MINTIWQIVDKLILSSTVYHIWNERNKRTFQNVMRTKDEVLVAITSISNIEDMLKCLRVKKSYVVVKAADTRGLTWKNEKLVTSLPTLCSAAGM